MKSEIGYLADLKPSNRDGKNKIALIKAKQASTANHASRKGSSNNHTIGNRINTRMASGQHRAKSRHHKTSVNRVFTFKILSAALE